MEQAGELLNFKLGRQAKIDLSIQSNYFLHLILGSLSALRNKTSFAVF